LPENLWKVLVSFGRPALFLLNIPKVCCSESRIADLRVQEMADFWLANWMHLLSLEIIF